MLEVLVYLIPVIIIIGVLKSPLFKGVAGELNVNLLTKLFWSKKKYHLIKNVTLPSVGGTTQTDHIIVSKYGVFVVETKNLKRWLFGRVHQRTWTQKIHKHTNKFQNPLNQNYKHVETLKSILGLDDRQVRSVIVFIGESTFKTSMPDNVTNGFGYIRFIRSKLLHVIPDEEIPIIVDKIEASRLTPSFKTNREHLNNVRNIVNEKRNNHGNKIWGCSTFPQCRETAAFSNTSKPKELSLN